LPPGRVGKVQLAANLARERIFSGADEDNGLTVKGAQTFIPGVMTGCTTMSP
jgi:hypothetical protein